MIETPTKKVQQLIKLLLVEAHVDHIMAKWLSPMPDPPRIPVSYTLNFTNRHPLVNLHILHQGVTALQNGSHYIQTHEKQPWVQKWL